MIENGKRVTFDYTLKVEGEVVDSSDGQTPFEYTHGEQGIIPGLARQLEGMQEGEEKNIVVSPDEAYGQPDPAALKEVQRTALPADVDPQVGMQFEVRTEGGRMITARLSELKDETVILDFNHPLAGKTLQFDVVVRTIA